ncbi:MAG TPA: type II toxin-antitoxin system RelE/ParE family toxin [Rhodocyclaceae bacterium]|nr:type II toxin-antitoxin system RelE/ParE family toxin [Rhodocyclaceae bacterium]
MPRILYAPKAFDDLQRLVDFLLPRDPAAAEGTFGLIESAVSILASHPLIGRSCENGMRELVISRGSTGYLALYRYSVQRDEVVILALRHQREAGWVS